jgi:biopolymer transport protein ExbD
MNNPCPAVDADESNVDLTPMLDVVFIMLVFFIITATFLNESGIPVNLPIATEQVTEELESIVVQVKPGGTFVVENRVLSKGGLLSYVQAVYSQNPEASFALLVTRGSRVGDMVAAADAGRRLGFDVIPISMKD